MTGGLVFEQASRSYAGLEALASLDLSCPAGSLTCIIGPNGAGKSTALGLASGLIRPSRGRVSLDGVSLMDLDGNGAVRFLPQRSVFPGSLYPREILEFSRRACSAPYAASNQMIQLAGLRAVLDKPVGALSGGWARRLGLACALLGPTHVLLLDEPFVGLDPEVLDRLKDHLCERSRGGEIVVLSSHAFEDADDLRPQLVLLDEGHLRAVRPPASVKARTLYQEVLAPHSTRNGDDGSTPARSFADLERERSR
jgi:ABC-type multidrug transport system ATPase subunit